MLLLLVNTHQVPISISTIEAHQGIQCLRHTNVNVSLEYPEDAEEHFNEIHRVMYKWSQPPGHKMVTDAGFKGPWIENWWISRAKELNASRAGQSPLSSVFGPFIPLLLNWVDVWFYAEWHYPPAFLSALRKLLRPNVPYVTVSQNDEGITGKCELLMTEFPNILVLSAGGYGHIPVPLVAAKREPVKPRRMESRPFLTSYVGSMTHAPHGFRADALSIVKNMSKDLNFTCAVYYGTQWDQVMMNSRTSLVLRGYGRTAYHLVETIQMGLIPVYVYSDVPWLPYADLFPEFGYAANLTGLPALLRLLARQPPAALAQRERLVAKYQPLFTLQGAVNQVFLYLQSRPCELRCTTLPTTVRDDGPCLKPRLSILSLLWRLFWRAAAGGLVFGLPLAAWLRRRLSRR
eukprot:EG_transcript_10410